MSTGLLGARRDRLGREAAQVTGRALAALERRPGWVVALTVYGCSRVLTTLITLAVARWQAANLWTTASPGYLAFTADLWDSSWYHKIAQHGYPLPLPRGAGGVVQQSEWAFFPAYPFLVRAVMTLTRASWELAAPTTSLLLGAVAVVGLHRLFRRVGTARVATGGVVLVCAIPSSPVLQYAYTEALALAALAWALVTLAERRYPWCALCVVALGASRAVALPFALVVGAHALARWRAGRAEPFRLGARAALAGLALLSVASGVAWPLAVGALTGVPHAYTLVQGAWRTGPVRWFVPWVNASRLLLGPLGPVALVVAVAALLWWLSGPAARRAGPEIPAWGLAYAAYLLAVVDPWTSVFRFLLLQAPLGVLVASSTRSRAHLLTLAAAGVALQVVWVAWIWRFSPPSDYPP